MGPIHSPPVPAGHTGAVPLGDGPPDRRRLFGRLAAMFFAGSGVLGLVTLPLPAPGSGKAATAAVYAVALALGIAIWFAPWERWPRWASLAEDLTTLAWADDRALLRLESLPLDGFLHDMAAKAGAILGDRVRVVSGIGGATLRADPQRLTQALVNLLQNAADHAEGGGPVRLRVQAGPSSWRFEVADDGGGLPPGDEQVIFEPLNTGASRGGMGLGLSIVRGIARAHGGEAGAVNRPRHGVTFWIRIPR